LRRDQMRDVAGAGGPSASRGEKIARMRTAPDRDSIEARRGGGCNASGPHYTQQSHCIARGRKRDYLRCTPHSTTRLPEGTFRGSVDAWPWVSCAARSRSVAFGPATFGGRCILHVRSVQIDTGAQDDRSYFGFSGSAQTSDRCLHQTIKRTRASLACQLVVEAA
jgi:hypothetical protein